jgi:predicted SAM-dependent methyltransferase
MPLSTISLKRPINSYARVQAFQSIFKRGNKFFINYNKIKNKVLLNVGCGPFPKPEFINLDYFWTPKIDICWDIASKPYPLPDNSIEGIFTEHCLEHIPFVKCAENIKEFYRLLKPGGIVRIVVPDGELYCDLFQKRKTDKTIILPYGQNEETAMISINRIFRIHGHLFIYDFETLQLLLRKAGFEKISKQKFGQGRDQRLVIDQEERAIESLYVEAIKT